MEPGLLAVHGNAGRAARGGAWSLGMFWCQMENGLAANLTTSALSQWLVPYGSGCGPFSPHQDEDTTTKQEGTVQVLEPSSVNIN